GGMSDCPCGPACKLNRRRPHTFPAILGSIVPEPTLGPMAGTRAEKQTWHHGRTVIRASDFVLEARESAQCDFPISALNVCETLRDTWPCRAPFDVRF